MQAVETAMEFKEAENRRLPRQFQLSTVMFVILGVGRGYLGVQDHPKELADIVEASIGAVFKDSGYDLVQTHQARFRASLLSAVSCRPVDNRPLAAWQTRSRSALNMQ
jgi:dsRNA-specific ribonuclease